MTIRCDFCREQVDGDGIGHAKACPLHKDSPTDDVRTVTIRADLLHKIAIVMNSVESAKSPLHRATALVLVPKLGNALHAISCKAVERDDAALQLKAYDILMQAMSVFPDVDCSKL